MHYKSTYSLSFLWPAFEDLDLELYNSSCMRGYALLMLGSELNGIRTYSIVVILVSV